MTPLVRKLAKDNGIDLSTVKGTGLWRIRKQDVQAAIAAKGSAAPAAAAPAAAAAPLLVPQRHRTPSRFPQAWHRREDRTFRQVIAKRMRESRHLHPADPGHRG